MRMSLRDAVHRLSSIIIFCLGLSLSDLPVGAQPCMAVPEGLISWWQAEDSGFDSTGRNPAIVPYGAFAPGRVGTAFSFHGDNQPVQIPNSSSLNPGNALTLEAWVYLSSYAAKDFMFVAGKDDPIGERQYLLGLANVAGNWVFSPHVGVSNGFNYFNGKTKLRAQTRYHAAMTYDGKFLKLYVNGRLDGSLAVRGPILSSTNPFLIGGPLGGPGSLIGRVDELSLYSRALTASELGSIYLAGTKGKCAIYPPAIASQPSSQTVKAGKSVKFTVRATGTQPLYYQWRFNGVGLPNATRSSLTISHLQPNESGNYSVVVSNVAGSVVSAAARLTVQATQCTPPPSAMVGWWRADSNAKDSAGANDGSIGGGLSFADGEVGKAFSFTGRSNYVNVPASPAIDVGKNNGFTAEAWIKPTDQISLPIFEWSPNGAYGTLFYANHPTTGTLYADLVDSDGFHHIFQSASDALTPDSWQHVALSYDRPSGLATLFVNGNVVAQSTLGSFTPETSHDLFLGYRLPGAPYGEGAFSGLIDEASLYHRALAPNEIQAIFQAGGQGKCALTPSGPIIISQPASLTVLPGQPARFSLAATGSQPLLYQWRLNGTNVPGETGSSLTISNAYPIDAGVYSAVVSNTIGVVVSSNATLTVMEIPTNCVPAPFGLVSWWKAEGSPVDALGRNPGVMGGNLGYRPGKVGQAFSFSTNSGFLRVPASASLNVGLGNGLTLEAWVQPDQELGEAALPIFEWSSAGTYGVLVYANFPSAGFLYASVADINGNLHLLQSGGAVLRPNTLQHVALTYDRAAGIARLLLDGVTVASQAFGNFTPKTDTDLLIGYRVPEAPFGVGYYKGLIDEASLYNRGLATNEIWSIYSAGSAGKCATDISIAPQIVSQPESQTVVPGATVAFSVGATGTLPLVYQWRFEEADLPGATSSNLILSNVQPINAGVYSVLVSNVAGIAISSNAVLTVIAGPTNCTPSPAGMVSWWKAEGNFQNSIGSQLGTGTVSFASGQVGQAFVFGGSDYVVVPASIFTDIGNADGMTIEGWVRPEDSNGRPFVEWSPNGTYGAHVYVNYPTPGSVYANLFDTAGTHHFLTTSTNALIPNAFNHLAVTYDKTSGVGRIVINGLTAAEETLGSFTPQTSYDLALGYRLPGAPFGVDYFKGLIDELSLYTRALSTNEVRAIFAASSAGKCGSTNLTAPLITGQPTSQSVLAGSSATFSVVALGTAPLLYQWRFEAANLPGATSSTLVLTNVEPIQAGSYSVLVSNAAGVTISSSVMLNVVPSPTNCIPAPAGLVSWWRAESSASDALGNNSGMMGGSLTYGPGKVAQAFSYLNNNGFIKVPASASLNVGMGEGFTLEAWIQPDQTPDATALPIFEWSSTNNYGVLLYANFPSVGYLYASVTDIAGRLHLLETSGSVITSNALQHVALTYDRISGVARLLLDGVTVAQEAFGTFTPKTDTDLTIGFRIPQAPFGVAYYSGLIDEASLYSRALDTNEIWSIYTAGSAGKCAPLAAPSLVTPPLNSPQGVMVAFKGAPGQTLRVERALSLLGPWTPVGAITVDQTGSSVFIDTAAPKERAFYRTVH